ncbi:MAG: topoisomerase [Methanobacteriota archaeon]|jgi:5S rRNA maturation endonuclease (ribonuclease M5)|nr:MAG: topoisomerase [Euryarchaeota archaeon]
MVQSDQQKRLDKFNYILEFINLSNYPILVEGKRDKRALKELDCTSKIIELNNGNSLLSTVESLVKSYSSKSFIILTDWDRTGNILAEKLKKYGESCDLIPNMKIRNELIFVGSKDITCIEELPPLIYKFRRETKAYR